VKEAGDSEQGETGGGAQDGRAGSDQQCIDPGDSSGETERDRGGGADDAEEEEEAGCERGDMKTGDDEGVIGAGAAKVVDPQFFKPR